jgi:hypothetical protein
MRVSDILKLRLSNQRLSVSKFDRPIEVVRWLGGVQAQDYNAAKWALALRSANATELKIEEAFNKGQILRTHVLRPTWHFVTPEDIRWLLELTSPRVNAVCAHYYRKFELDDRFFRRAHKVISKALQKERYLTRVELRDRLIAQRVEPGDAVRMGFILIRAELDGLVCSGPRRGKQLTYALLDERVSPVKSITRDEALANLSLRYFKSHGPATPRDFAWWSGLSLSDVKAGVGLVANKLQFEQGYYFSGSASDGIPEVVLLPAFDEYLVGYTDRSAANGHSSEQDALPNAIFNSVVLIRGLVKGDWSKKTGARELVISVNNWSKMSRTTLRALESAAANYGRFAGLAARIDLLSTRT